MIIQFKHRIDVGMQAFSDREHYKQLCTYFVSISLASKSRVALDNLKVLFMLDLNVLLGADISWKKTAASGFSEGQKGPRFCQKS